MAYPIKSDPSPFKNVTTGKIPREQARDSKPNGLLSKRRELQAPVKLLTTGSHRRIYMILFPHITQCALNRFLFIVAPLSFPLLLARPKLKKCGDLLTTYH